MTYQISRGPNPYDADPLEDNRFYLVEKVLDAGDAYTVGSFTTLDDARKCLNTLRSSVEVRRGATVTEAA